jgi:hypothetical protein
MAYVEFFNRLPASPQKDTGLFAITRSFRQNQRHAAIVRLSSIHLPCHLTPQFGDTIPPAWLLEGGNYEDPLDSDRGKFLLNPFVTLSTYSFFFRLGMAPLAEARLPLPTKPIQTNSSREAGNVEDVHDASDRDDESGSEEGAGSEDDRGGRRTTRRNDSDFVHSVVDREQPEPSAAEAGAPVGPVGGPLTRSKRTLAQATQSDANIARSTKRRKKF